MEDDQAALGTNSAHASDIASLDILPQGKGAYNAYHTDASSVKMARMALLDKLEYFIGSYLHDGMMASRLRKGELNRRIRTLTDAIRLHLASKSPQDFKLEIWLCATIGKDIVQAAGDPIERMRSILGDYLFEAWSTSIWWRQAGTEPTARRVLPVSFPQGDDGDCKIEVMLNFETGRHLLDELYPS